MRFIIVTALVVLSCSSLPASAARWNTDCNNHCRRNVPFGNFVDPVCKNVCDVERGIARTFWCPDCTPPILLKDCEFNTNGVAVDCR